jgi:hypothetical protein
VHPRVLEDPKRRLTPEKADVMLRAPGVTRASGDVKPRVPNHLGEAIRRKVLMLGGHEPQERVQRVERPQGPKDQVLLGHQVGLAERHLALG